MPDTANPLRHSIWLRQRQAHCQSRYRPVLEGLECRINPYGAPNGVDVFVWHDVDADGTSEASERGLPDATVELFVDPDGVAGNGDEILVTTLTTDSNGRKSYFFGTTDLRPHYLLFHPPVSPPGATTFTTPNVGVDSNDSDVDPVTGRSEHFQSNAYRTFAAGLVDYPIHNAAPSFTPDGNVAVDEDSGIFTQVSAGPPTSAPGRLMSPGRAYNSSSWAIRTPAYLLLARRSVQTER